jgi:hypothetical protein
MAIRGKRCETKCTTGNTTASSHRARTYEASNFKTKYHTDTGEQGNPPLGRSNYAVS